MTPWNHQQWQQMVFLGLILPQQGNQVPKK